MQLFTQCTLVRLQWANTFPIGSTFDRSILKNRCFILLARCSHFDSPTLDMVAGAGIDLHIIPVIAGEILCHSLGQRLCTPLSHKVMAPHAYRDTIYLLTS